MTKKIKTGLVLGKFMPFHQGHELLIRFAKNYVDRLYVVVDNVSEERYVGEYIPESMRAQWIARTFPEVEVFCIPQPTPQNPSEHNNFWNIWKTILLDLVPTKPDYLFASEPYGFKLAHVLGSNYIPFDGDRGIVSTSATAIRRNFKRNWRYLTEATKKDFTLRVCVFGPESTGKTMLAKTLAQHFKTVWVPEHARVHLEAYTHATYTLGKEYAIQYEEMLEIAAGQLALEDTLMPHAQKMLVCDTDALMTAVWSMWLFGKVDAQIFELVKRRKYDLYLLMKPDIPWKKDAVRYFPAQQERVQFFEDCKKILEDHERVYTVIEGVGEQRIQNAIRAVERLIKDHFNYQYFVEQLK